MMKKFLIPVLFLVLLTTLAVPAMAEETYELHYFGLDTCSHCANLRIYLDQWETDYPELTIIRHDASKEQDLFKQMLEQYDVPQNEWGTVPRLFISNFTCLGDTPCIEDAPAAIEKVIEYGSDIPESKDDQPQELHIEKLVALAAADAVSPCELAVLTMLLTAIMVRNPGKKRKILWAGLAFALAVFSIYFGFGALITLGFKSVTGIAGIQSGYLFKILAVMAIILGLVNLKDFFQPEKPLAEVPTGWRPKMKKIIGKTASVPGAFVTGIIVSLFLTPCTIGPYFVAGGILSELTWTTSLPLLFMYNLIFITPMVGLVILIYFGVSTIEKTSKWRKHAWKYTHLLIAALMFGLGIAMWIGWI